MLFSKRHVYYGLLVFLTIMIMFFGQRLFSEKIEHQRSMILANYALASHAIVDSESNSVLKSYLQGITHSVVNAA